MLFYFTLGTQDKSHALNSHLFQFGANIATDAGKEDEVYIDKIWIF